MNILIRILNLAITFFALNHTLILGGMSFWGRFAVGLITGAYFIFFNILPTFRKYPSFRLKVMGDGAELLLAFFVTTAACLPLAGWGLYGAISGSIEVPRYVTYCVLVVLGEAALFWNGIIRVYLTSVQLGIRLRVLGIVLGWIPIANLVMLMYIYVKVRRECRTETEKARLDESRSEQRVCATKYPLLLVHGVFFRDSKYLNYWGRIPAELEKNGATVLYGDQQSALSVADSAQELARRIKQIVEDTGCKRLNIIAHSKGGLDSRYAISKLGCDKYVASLTTINTPHRGCIFAEYLLEHAPEKLVKGIEKTYNSAFAKLGDASPDFMSAVRDLTSSFCTQFNEEVPDSPNVIYRSVGSKSNGARGGRFPLNISHPIVKKFDGDNDGLVALTSAKWGESFTPLYPTGRRGITHADVIDLNREDIKGFDVREFYVGIVSQLKERGL